MILHPGIISLLAGTVISSIMLLYGSYIGWVVFRRWDSNSSSEEQLLLERKTYLISTILNFILLMSVLSTVLFIYTVDDIHRMFTGAMCATGSLNANPTGWYILLVKIIVLFLASFWLAINHIDQRSEDYPLIYIKFGLIILITPLMLSDASLQYIYFSGLDPNIITSCCGALFSEGGKGIASTMSGFQPRIMQYIFFASIFSYIAIAIITLIYDNKYLRYITGSISSVLGFILLASMVSFISLYFYEIPTHHCPFDILQGYYNYVGYPLYISLFGGIFFGTLTGVSQPLRRIVSINDIIGRLQKKWIVISLVFILAFTIISVWPMVFSTFTLEGY